jgi:formate hydrogenlyase subunit 6/NADH:ubiquinone oxidoreductase subunit I
MRHKMPWVDRLKCDVAEVGESCKAAKYCPHAAFTVTWKPGDENGQYDILIDLERCRRCGECSHACDKFAVKMV